MAKPKQPGMIQRRRNAWRVVLRVGGKRYQFGPRTEPLLRYGTRNDVVEWSWRKYEELKKAAKREEAGLPGRVPFSVLVRKYETEELPDKARGTQRAYRDSLKPVKSYFFEVLGDPMLDQIRTSHIKAFLSWRRTHRADGTPAAVSLSTRSRSKDRAVLSQIFAFADVLELREGNPVRRVPKLKGDERQPVLLTNEQCEALLNGCNDPMVHLYLLLLDETGARCESEALWLRWEDVDFERGFVTIVSGRDDHRTNSTPPTP